jgi:PHD/YefM family antitoxin component YafN of YafNO toxin-antitoxin module
LSLLATKRTSSFQIFLKNVTLLKIKTMSPLLVTDKKGRQTGVLLSIKDYNKLKEMAEDLADIKAYDKAKARSGTGKLIPLREVIKQRKQKP